MRLPATSERIRMYCADSLAKMAACKMLGNEGDDGAAVIEKFQPQGSY